MAANDVILHVALVLAALRAVRAAETRRLVALVLQVTVQSKAVSVLFPALKALLDFSLVPSLAAARQV